MIIRILLIIILSVKSVAIKMMAIRIIKTITVSTGQPGSC